MAALRRSSSSLTVTSTSSRTSTASLESEARDGVRKSKKKVLLVITGGSGWLGSTIAKLAYRHWEELREIRLFDLNPPQRNVISSITGFSSPSEGKPKISYLPGSILEESDLLSCFAKADVVIHCAGLVENGSILLRRRMRSVNVDGTQKVVQACLECGVRGLVFTGSVLQVVQTDTTWPVRYDESCQPTKELIFPHYGGSKSEAENLVLVADGKEGREGIPLRTCSLRCPVMYGEGDKSMIPPVIQTAKRCFGYFLPLGLTGNNGVTLPSLYVGNGAWAHIVAARKLLELEEAEELTEASAVEIVSDAGLEVGGKFFYIGDHSPDSSLSNFFSQFLRPLGYRVLPVGVPFGLVRIFVFFLEFMFILLAFFRIDFRSTVDRGTLQYFKLSHSISWEKAKRELGYTPLFSHQNALAESMEYYRKTS